MGFMPRIRLKQRKGSEADSKPRALARSQICFHVKSDNRMRLNNSVNRKHMFDLTTQTSHSTLQAGLLVIKMKLKALSVINGTMMKNVTISKQD